MSAVQDLSVDGNGDHLPGEEFAAVPEGGLYRRFQAAAAGDLHADHGDALDLVVLDDLEELFRIVHGIQLGAADQGDLAGHQLLVEPGVGKGGAVGGDQ